MAGRAAEVDMEKDVTRGIEEQLSAFLDGELPEEEVALLVRRLELDDTYRMTLTSYAAIGGVLRDEPRELGSARFRAGVMQAIDNVSESEEPVEELQGSARRMPYTLIATAAALGLVAVLAGVFRPGAVPGPELLSSVPEEVGTDGLIARSDSAGEVAGEIAGENNTQQTGAKLEGPGESLRPVQPLGGPTAALASVSDRSAQLKRERMTSYLISHGQQAGSFPGTFGDSRMYVQQASFTE